MTFAIIAGAYILVAGLFVRLVQFGHERDEMMHALTAEWIEETSRS